MIARLIRRHRDHDDLFLTLRKRHARWHRGQGHTIGRHVQTHPPDRTAGMGDLQQQPALIPRCHETGKARADHHRITHQNIRLGLPHGAGRPCHGHQPHGAVEGGQIEPDHRAPIRAHGDGTAEKGKQVLGRRRRLQPHPRACIPAGSHLPHGPVQTVDQAAIDIAQFHPQTPLPEVMGGWVRAVETRQVQDTQINSRQRDMGHLVLRYAIHLHGNLQRPARVGGLWRVDADGQLPRAGINARMGQTQRPCGHPPRRRIHWPDHGRGDIGPRAPIISDGLGDQRLALGNRDRLHRDQAVRHHRDTGNPRMTRHDPQHRGFAAAISGLVQGQFQQIRRRGGIRRRIPASVEPGRGGGIDPLPRLDHQFVLPPVHRGRNLQRFGPKHSLALVDAGACGDRLPLPFAELLIPLITRLDPVHAPANGQRGRGQIG